MLGFIVAPLGQKVEGQYPNEINYSYGGAGTYLCPDDPMFNTRGEPGILPTDVTRTSAFYDTPLGGLNGGIPTDAELAYNYGYTPVISAWVDSKEGYIAPPWRTPNGWNPAGAWGPPNSLSGPTVLGLSPLFWGLAVAGIGALLYFNKSK